VTLNFAKSIIASLLIGGGWVSHAVASDAAGLEFFEKKVRPVLAERCYECHSHQAKKLKANLYLDSRDGMLQGGDTGVAIVLGEPEKSRLVEAIRYTNADLQMPPKQKLPDAVIADFIEWIKLGAPWPKEEAPRPALAATEPTEQQKRKREHWAWQPIRAPIPPVATSRDRGQNEIDAFILARLEEKGLTPARPADRRSLIRRAYFDLIGLPPSPEEVEEFISDKSPDAFVKVIDRLLASPHYGERFGRHWLDIARYGEDQAHSFQPRLYPQGFRYRDWLVRALNRDMPYDQFIVEQIAGDLLDAPDRLDQLPALGFFALGPVYYGDAKMFDQLDDRVDTLTRGFLGLTVACARCHDHKFDPIAQKDYYALAGVFASSEYVEAPLAPPEVVDAYNRAQAAIDAKSKQIDSLLDREATKLSETLRAEVPRYMVAAWKLLNQRKNEPKTSTEQAAKQLDLRSFALERWMNYLSPQSTNQRPHLALWFQTVEKQDAKTDFSTNETAAAEIGKVAEAFQKLVLSTVKLRDALDAQYAASLANAVEKEKEKLVKPSLEKSQAALLDEVVGKDGLLAVSKKQVENLLASDLRSQLAELRTELERLKKDAPQKFPFAHSLKESSKTRDLPVLARGNQESPGEETPRRFLSILSGENAPPFKDGSGRLELARAIANKNNPLTARVMVNRIWQHHFGQGLVRTPSNFGLLGEPPTHPELLDYLAAQFMEQGWSMKSLHRLIMLSATYQMSGRFDARSNELDPDNKYIWRMNRRRLEVEAWRDAMLAVSGNLDRTIGGASVQLASPDNRRRTFYAVISRHDLDSLLRLFDFPDPNVTSDQRSVTTVPLQQLFVLNSEFLIRQARTLACRLNAASDEADPSRIRHAYMLVYGRPPTDDELQLGLEFVADAKAGSELGNGGGEIDNVKPGATSGALSRWEQYSQVLLSANEFMYVD
jgi:cytochrome c553